MVTNGEMVSTTVLAKKTGLSYSFFYNNQKVKEIMFAARNKQMGMKCSEPKRTIIDRALQVQNEKLVKENCKLKDKVKELNEKVSKYEETISKYNLMEYLNINPYE